MKKGLWLLALAAMLAVPASAYVPVGLDTFTYGPAGPLNTVGAPRWTGTAGAEIAVTPGYTVQVFDNGKPANTTSNWSFTAFSPASKLVQVSVDARSGSTVGGGGNIYSVWAYDSAGAQIARWYGSGSGAIGRVGGTVTSPVTLSATAWTTLDMILDYNTYRAYFYADGVKLMSGVNDYIAIPTTIKPNVARLQFESWNRNYNPSNWIFFDNLGYGYVPEPSGLLVLATFGVGLLGYIRRRK